MGVGGTFARGESRHPEWDLMYRKGLTVSRISSLCRAGRETVGRHIRVQRAKFPDMQAEHEACRPQHIAKTPGPSWLANVEALSALVVAEGRYPTSSESDSQRRRLAHWLSVQRRDQRAGRLTQAKLAALNVLPAWQQNQRFDLAQKQWHERLMELQAFVHERGRWPRFRKASSEAERSLGVWLHAQRQKASRGVMSDAETAALQMSEIGRASCRERVLQPV